MLDVALAPALPLVGRAVELGTLRAAWRRATNGESSAVVVAGDAGIGKTRLLAEVAGEVEADGGLALLGHCLGLGQAAPPFLPVLEILTQLRDLTDDPEIAADCRQLLAADVAGDQVRLFDGVLGVLTRASAAAPVLVVVEDLHWSDPSTRDLLLFLLARLGSGRLLAVLSYRSDDLHRQHPLRPWLAGVVRMGGVERLDVAPFDAEESVALVTALMADDADPRVVADVADRSEGNAFFAEELSSAAADGDTELSDVLASVLLDRIERLSPPAQRVVRAGAVVGQRDLWASSLERLAASPAVGLAPADVEAALRECVQSHVLVVAGDGAFAFRHALLREAVLADLLPGERSRLHAAYVQVLEQERPPGWHAALAFHAARSGDLALALRSRLDAAHEAGAMAAHADALAHLEAALELWAAVPDPETVSNSDEVELLLQACDAATASGRVDRAVAYGRAALAAADDRGTVLQQAGARRRLAKTLYAGDGWREAERLIAQAWALLEDGPATVERAWVMSTMSFGDPAEPERQALAERAIAESRALGAPGPEADAQISLAFVLQHRGDVEAAREQLRQARATARSGEAHDTELRAMFNTVMLDLDRGRLDEAAALAVEAADVAAAHGRRFVGYGREVVWLQQVIDLARGRFADVVARTDAWIAADPPGLAGELQQSRAVASAWRGDWDTVRADVAVVGRPDEVVAKALRGAEVLAAASAVVEAWLWQGRPDDVVTGLEAALAAPEFEGDVMEVRVGALLLTAYADLRGRDAAVDPERVRELLERVERVARDGVPRGSELGPEGRLWLVRARAEAARALGEETASAWAAVVDAAEYGERPQEAVGRWRLGVALLETGDETGADELRRAHALAGEMGAAPLAAAVEASARRFRAALPGAGGDGPLTPRERSVLERVAQGKTNRAIGAELFISEKTVSVHLSRVMAKLEVASRTEAVAVALSRGLLAR